MLTPEQQADFVHEAPEIFLPIKGGLGRMGMTHIRLAKATEDLLAAPCARPGNSGWRRMQGRRRRNAEGKLPSRVVAADAGRNSAPCTYIIAYSY